ncbi:nitroreductase family protein [Bacteroidales bacterium OttesenSCG-928-B11]|nr:nitroreductase family protein [Bacteroidales bacterium OttesenSCG-928-E04]MDL2311381.1 nitroreductase family protein [Bacteroidales bacterium OttesenSCG-928-B11]MDL2325777.1 nitroreductase family protein [Bacteroidales bacterium OttesenSCG-928-A14]
MSTIEAITLRKSVRSYANKPLSETDRNAILNYISELKQPLGGKAHIELVSTHLGDQPVKLGTYGVISNAKNFLVLLYEPGLLAEQNAGYLFEQIVLFCTTLNLGTCWLGGTFSRSDFVKHVQIKENEQLRMVSPVGYPAEKTRWLDRLMRKGAGSDHRKPFEKLFFENDFETPLTPEKAGEYAQVLEMVRLAPSASNSQPWRIVKSGNHFHFYDHAKGMFSANDLGIALCHFGETCKELNLKGKFEIVEERKISREYDDHYITSWYKE